MNRDFNPGKDFLVPKDPRLELSMINPFVKIKGDSNSLKSWGGVHYFYWARNAIYHGLSALEIESGKNILVPAYHCKALIHPILLYGANVKYYNVTKNCTLDLDDMISKIDENTRAVLIIHYFGFPQSIHFVKELCEKKDLFLIEDCAHVLPFDGADPILGRDGDISVFSIRKYLPICDGGSLVINHPGLSVNIQYRRDILGLLKDYKNFFDRLIHDSRWGLLERFSKGFSYSAKKGFDVVSAGSEDFLAGFHNPFSEDMTMEDVNLGMTFCSKRTYISSDFAPIVTKRRANYDFYLREFRKCDRIKVFFPDMGNGICPLVFPFALEGSEGFHLKLRERGIPATTWGGVIHPGCPTSKFPDAEYLYGSLCMLPVHQSLTEQELRYVADMTMEAIQAI